MPRLGKISTTAEAFQLCVPCSLERTPLARHYFRNIKGFGLSERHTCGTAVLRGTIQRPCQVRPSRHQKSPLSLSPFQRCVPPLSPGRPAAAWGTSHFLSSPDPSGPHSEFLFRPSARRGRESGGRRHSSPSWQLAA